MSKPPAHTIRFGLIKACVWSNQTKDGTRFRVTINRFYKDGDAWKESQRFGRDDLMLVGKVANEAHTWIYEQTSRQRLHETNGAAT